ncbi:FAD-dependent monooxygenase [Nisaea acidiphila]|uniref:FAD-dependent monooxygenase n=1 Tax=Nisaea acidiphila TaxID=1862145 RepID=A0A9J7APR5_9PROT|nr:FAD-dependent monooxygenase [Nisaea acidiphila]UUX49207.1 FAD-dependent monooxygenase [Nisaea acidiphila]
MQPDIAVIGNGPTAQLATHALSASGFDALMVGPPADRTDDPRTTALMPSSVESLDSLGVDVRQKATPLLDLRIETTGPFGLVSELFTAADAREEFLAQNLFIKDLLAVMPEVNTHSAAATRVVPGDDRVHVECADGTSLEVRLVIAADGFQSIAREAAGITLRKRSLGRSALCVPVNLEQPHHRLCIERYDDTGTLTLIPVAEYDASLITIAAPEDIAALAAHEDDVIARKLSRRQPAFGAIRFSGAKAVFPLSLGFAPRPAQNRVVAIGESAHIAPPIAAQGWNMSVRDIMTLTRLLSDARDKGDDVGAPGVLARYAPQRQPDVAGRLSAIGALAGVATRPAPAQKFLRQAGLMALGRIQGAKRGLMRAGLR